MRKENPTVHDHVWRVFYVRPRAEKKTAEELGRAGHEVFLPLRTVLRQWSDRKKKVSEPLFTGYLFAHVDERARLAVLQHSAVVRCVSFGGSMAQVSGDEIEQLKLLQATPEALEAVTMQAFPKGSEVFLTHGPLAGVRGRVIDHPKTLYLLVEVPAIRHAVRVHVPADWVMRNSSE